MTKYWEVIEGDDPWEPPYPCFKTSNKGYAEWYCEQVNKTTDMRDGGWEYYIREHSPLKICLPDYHIWFSFCFNVLPELELDQSNQYVYGADSLGYDAETNQIRINAEGASYEECLANAEKDASVIRESIIFLNSIERK